MVRLDPPSTSRQAEKEVQMRSWQLEKFPGMSFKSKNKKRGKSIIQFVAYKTDCMKAHEAQETQRWSKHVRASEE